MSTALLFLAAASMVGPAPSSASAQAKGRWPAADQPVERTDANSRLAHQQMLKNLKKGRIDLYFVGDSITRRWRATDYPRFLANWNANFHGWNAANFGWGGDTIGNILWRVQNGELDGVHPRVIVVLAGTNNVGRVPADEDRAADVVKGIKALLDTMRKRRRSPKSTRRLRSWRTANRSATSTSTTSWRTRAPSCSRE
jgi:hypothetical protein